MPKQMPKLTPEEKLKSDYDKRLFQKFPEIETKDITEWTTYHLVGYFAKKYKDFYKTDLVFSYSTPQVS